MNQVNSVLVATDFSETARVAVDGAIAVAKSFEAKLHVVHAFETPVPFANPYDVVVPQGFLDDALHSAGRDLAKVVEKIDSEGLKAESHMTEGPAAPSIDTSSCRCCIDLNLTMCERKERWHR